MQSPWMDVKAEVIAQYRQQKELAEAALARVDDAAFFAQLRDGEDDHTNSLAVLVKHLGGNLRSRWTAFLTQDGEKADRQRPREFLQEPGDDRGLLMDGWETGWRCCFAALDALTDDDFARTVFIRDEPHSVFEAIMRNLLHTTHHIGQIDLLATALQT